MLLLGEREWEHIEHRPGNQYGWWSVATGHSSAPGLITSSGFDDSLSADSGLTEMLRIHGRCLCMKMHGDRAQGAPGSIGYSLVVSIAISCTVRHDTYTAEALSAECDRAQEAPGTIYFLNLSILGIGF